MHKNVFGMEIERNDGDDDDEFRFALCSSLASAKISWSFFPYSIVASKRQE